MIWSTAIETSEFYDLYRVWRAKGLQPVSEGCQLIDLVSSEKTGQLNETQRLFLDKARYNCGLCLEAWEKSPDYPEHEAPDFLEWFICLRYEGYQPLRLASGFVSLVLNKELGQLNRNQRHLLENVKSQCGLGLHIWDYSLLYLRWATEKRRYEITFSEMMQAVLSFAKEYFLPDFLIKTNADIKTAKFDSLIGEALTCLMLWNDQMPHQVITTISDGPNKSASFEVKILNKESLDEEPPLQDTNIGTRLNFADTIITWFGGELEAKTVANGVNFRFLLPGWFKECS